MHLDIKLGNNSAMAGKGGKTSTTWTSGNNPRMEPGTKHKKTVLKESLGLSNWDKLKSFIENEGAEKLVEEMGELTGKDFVNAFYSLAEYVKPKLQRTTHAGDQESPLTHSTLDGLTFEQLYALKYGKKPSE